MPLERSNIAMLLGSSGVVRSSENPLKMIVKMLTHAHGVVHLVLLAHLQRRKSWSMFINLGKQERLFGVLRRLGWLLE